MKTNAKAKRPKVPRGRQAGRRISEQMNQATGDEFEREGLGVAAKE